MTSSQFLSLPTSQVTRDDLSSSTQVIWITVLVLVKLLLIGVTGETIGSEQSVALSLSLDLIFLTIGFLYSRALLVTYLFTSILCISLYLSYHFEDGAKFTAGGDDEIYYNNFLTLVNSISFSDGYDSLLRTDLTSVLLALISVPFRLLGFEFKSPIDFFFLQASCLAPLGPLIRKLSMRMYGRNVGLLYFFAFTPYWYFGVVGREWPLYYIAILVTLLFSSYTRVIVYITLVFIFGCLAFYVRLEAVFIFGLFMLFHMRDSKKIFLAVIVVASISMLSVSDYFSGLLQFAAEKSRLVYFSQIEQSTGFGGALKYSESMLVKPFFILYLIFSPIPPYFYHERTLENFILLTGHLLWPLLIFAIGFQWRKFICILIDSVGVLPAVVGFGSVILLMAFYGGTNRHYYPFVPHLLLILPMFSMHRSLVHSLKRPFVALASIGSFYIVVSVIL